MRRRSTSLLLAAACLVALPGAAFAQDDPAGAELRIESVDASAYPDVRATVVAPRDLAGTELDGRHLTVAENLRDRDAAVRRVAADHQEIVLAIDTSGSMRGEALAGAQAAALEFLGATPAGARVAVVGFASEPEILQPFTSDRGQVRRAVEALEAHGSTTLYDAVQVGAGLFTDRRSARALIVLSDGADTASTAALEDVAAAVTGVAAGFYGVELVTPSSDRAALDGLADRAGGTVAAAADPAALADVYAAFAVDVSNRYEVSYRSSAYDLSRLTVELDAGEVRRSASAPVELPTAPAWRRVMGSPLALAAGIAGSFLGLSMLVLAALAPGRPRGSYPGLKGLGARPMSPIGGMANRASALAEATLGKRGRAAALTQTIERAGLSIKPGQFVVVAVAGVLAAGFLGTVLSGLLLGLVLGGVAAAGTKVFLSTRISRRQSQFADQLDDTLQLLAGSLRAGHSLLQALDAVSKEAEAPTREEFRQIVRETRIGRDLSAALQDSSQRMASRDFEWIVQSVAIHREVGGDLAAILDTAAGTIRERGQLRRQVKALSAEGKLSAYVLLALPLGLAGFMMLTNPSYIGVLTQHTIGMAMLGMCGVLMTAGGLWLRKLVRVAF